MDFSYYPGCSLHSTGSEFDASVQAVFRALNVGLHELEDWNCCGASSAHVISRDLSLALPARNLGIAEKSGMDVVMPCAACFNRHKSVDHEMRTDPQKRVYLEDVANFSFSGSIHVRPLIDIVANEIGLDKLNSMVKKPLKGLKAVGYYGCLLVRPPEVTGFENPDNPVLMNKILESLGAEALEYAYATECCGGGLTLTKSAIAARMVNRLIERARETGAEAMVTSCPLCQMNLEMRQAKNGSSMPIFYFTELIGLAFNLPESSKWWSKHLVSPINLLKEKHLI